MISQRIEGNQPVLNLRPTDRPTFDMHMRVVCWHVLGTSCALRAWVHNCIIGQETDSAGHHKLIHTNIGGMH